jgi:hypothetical protein
LGKDCREPVDPTGGAVASRSFRPALGQFGDPVFQAQERLLRSQLGLLNAHGNQQTFAGVENVRFA